MQTSRLVHLPDFDARRVREHLQRALRMGCVLGIEGDPARWGLTLDDCNGVDPATILLSTHITQGKWEKVTDTTVNCGPERVLITVDDIEGNAPTDELRAVARLIAQAPELLECLYDYAYDYMPRNGREDSDARERRLEALQLRARKAIENATRRGARWPS